MRSIQLILVSGGVLLAVARVATWHLQGQPVGSSWARALLGIVPGVIGAVLIMAFTWDLVPDEAEGPGMLVVTVLIGLVALAASLYSIGSRR